MVQRVIVARTTFIVIAATLALVFSSVFPVPASAALTSVSTATATASYRHPLTGGIEDSGGSSSAVLGQSMVEGVTGAQALVEVDADGITWVTVRLGLMSEIGDVSFSYDLDGAQTSYADAPATLMQQDAAADTGDYRFAVAGIDSVIRCSLYVAPMGRSVVFFISLSDPVAGNTAGFAESVTVGEEIAGSAGGVAASEQEQAASSAEQEVAEGSAAVEGVHEFDAEGNEMGSGSDGQQLSDGVSVAAVAAGVAAGVVAICGVTVYFAWCKPKRAKQDAAAAAAASAAGAGRTGSEEAVSVRATSSSPAPEEPSPSSGDVAGR